MATQYRAEQHGYAATVTAEDDGTYRVHVDGTDGKVHGGVFDSVDGLRDFADLMDGVAKPGSPEGHAFLHAAREAIAASERA